MADILPKFKLYTTISIMQIIMNIVILIFQSDLSSINSTLVGTVSIIGGFLPFASILNYAFLGLPSLLMSIVSIFTVIFSIVQTFLIVVMIANIVPTENV